MNHFRNVCEEVAKALEATQEYRVLRLLRPLEMRGIQQAGLQEALIVDTETTGLDTATAKIIEIALLPIAYNANLEIVDVGPAYHGLQDPGEPLSEEVKRVTGLVDENLTDRNIDWAHVDNMVTGTNIVIAHNAAFDRPILERHLASDSAKRRPWACSMTEIDWKRLGFPSTSLTGIATHMGRFFDAHRALDDVNALASILATHQFFRALLESARRTHYRVFATGSPYEQKDKLKARGYRWDDKGRVWYFDVTDNTCGLDEMPPLDLEMQWLRMNAACPRATFKELTARERYK